MEGENYTKRELDSKFGEVHERFTRTDTALESILVQTTAHNGRMRKIEKVLLIVGCITGTLLITNGSELIKFLMALIK